MTSYLLVQVFFLPKYNPNAFSLENLPPTSPANCSSWNPWVQLCHVPLICPPCLSLKSATDFIRLFCLWFLQHTEPFHSLVNSIVAPILAIIFLPGEQGHCLTLTAAPEQRFTAVELTCGCSGTCLELPNCYVCMYTKVHSFFHFVAIPCHFPMSLFGVLWL